MQWERAKNFILMFFLLINILLALLLIRENDRYSISSEREQAVLDVIGQNNISIYTKIIPQYKPMRLLSISGYTYDTDKLIEMLFENPGGVRRVEDEKREIFEDDIACMTISNGYISFYKTNVSEEERKLPSNERAVSLCKAFIDKNFPEYVQDEKTVLEDGYRIRYRQMFQKYLVYGNFIEFFVTEDGIEKIEMQYGEVIGFSGSAHEICAPDEALLTFIQHIRNIYPEEPIIIEGMDIVYEQNEYSNREFITLQASPYYRIFIYNHEVPFLINAITNICIN